MIRYAVRLDKGDVTSLRLGKWSGGFTMPCMLLNPRQSLNNGHSSRALPTGSLARVTLDIRAGDADAVDPS